MNMTRRYRLAKPQDTSTYRHDPEHKHKPKDGTWFKTEEGWSTIDPEKTKPQSPEQEAPQVSKEEKAVLEKQEEAKKKIGDYYGEIDSEEKEKVEQETLQRLSDYIKKVSQGETAELPELSDDDKEKFVQSVLIFLKAKQIASIPAVTGALKKQRDFVTDNLIKHAMQGFNSIVNNLESKSLVEKHIKPQSPESIFKPLERTDKLVKDMTDEELSDKLISEGRRDFKTQYARKSRFRDTEFKDLPTDYQKKAKDLADAALSYVKHFPKLNKDLSANVKTKKGKNGIGFVLSDYKDNDNSYYSDVSLPVDSMSFNTLAPALNETLKNLSGSGFNGRVEVSTNPENLALNRNNIRVVTDDPRHLVVANEMLKEAFANVGVNDVKSKIIKKQFGLTEDDQFDYGSKLRMLALKATSRGKITFPASDANKYLAAARLSGYDVIPVGNMFMLKEHDPKSNVGRLKIHAKDDPRETIQKLRDATLKDAESGLLPQKEEKLPFIPIEDPFDKIRKEQEHLKEESGIDEFDDSDLEGEEDPRLKKLKRRHKKLDLPSDEEIESTDGEAPIAEEPPAPVVDFNETLSDSVSSIEKKVKAKDASVYQDFHNLLTGIAQELQKGNDNPYLKSYQKAINMSAANLLKGGLLEKMPSETSTLFESVNNGVKKALTPPKPKTLEELGLEKVSGYKPASVSEADKPLLSKAEITGRDNFPTGWIANGNKLISSDFGHEITFDSKENAEKFAKDNPYFDKTRHLEVDPLDKDEAEITASEELKSGKKLDISKTPDTTKLTSFASKYGIQENSPAMKELLGFKRLILNGFDNDARQKIRETGLNGYLSGQSIKKLHQDFIERMNKDNYSGDDYIETKKKMSAIDPSDFAKMVSLIGKAKTASRQIRQASLPEDIIERISSKIT